MKQKIYLWADADKQIGYGHFVRTRALADMLSDTFDCTLFTKQNSDRQYCVDDSTYEVVLLPDDETRFDRFCDYLTGQEIVFLDNYYFDETYQQRIKHKGCKLVCMGSSTTHFFADIVISYIDNAQLLDVEPYTKLCLGLDWAILREPFYSSVGNCRNHRRITSIVICFGGSDSNHLTEKTISIINKAQIPTLDKIYVISSYDNCRNEDFALNGVSVLRNASASEIAHLFAYADVAIVSASGIAQEALSVKAPVISGYYIQNQKNLYDSLRRGNFIVGVGDMNDDSFENRLLTELNAWPEQLNYLQCISLTNQKSKYIELFNSLLKDDIA